MSSSELVRGVILPIYLTIMFIPILYYLTICSRWELLYGKIKDLTSVGPYIRRIRRRLALILIVMRVSGLHLKSSRFLAMPFMLDRIFISDQPTEVRKNIQYELEKVHREEAQQRELVERLEKYAGVTGVDEQGRQLDRREFSKTCERLEFLHLCHVGRWNHNKHYVVGLKNLVIVETLDSFQATVFMKFSLITPIHGSYGVAPSLDGCLPSARTDLLLHVGTTMDLILLAAHLV